MGSIQHLDNEAVNKKHTKMSCNHHNIQHSTDFQTVC